MKNYFLILLLFTGMVKAQIVAIPDVNFKNRLVTTPCVDADHDGNYDSDADVDNDGEIQLSEALAVTGLKVAASNISDLTGIEAFTNLEILECNDNHISVLNPALFPNLRGLNCEYNPITTLDISQNLNLTYLKSYYNQLTSLDVSQNLNLIWLMCSANDLTSIDVTNNLNLEYLFVGGNQLTTLDVTQNVNLRQLECSYNLLTFIDTSHNNALEMYLPSNNNLSANLDLSNLPNLIRLECQNANQTALDLSAQNNLNILFCGGNLFTTLDLSNLTKLTDFHCTNSLLTSLDLSRMGIDGGVNLYDLSGSANLTYVNIKNGAPFSWFTSASCPNLLYVCADESNIAQVQSNLISNGNSNVQVNSYCSFVPGGHYNTIAGTTTYDADANGCDSNDVRQSNVRININDGTNQGAAFTRNDGSYSLYTQAGNFEITPAVENPTWFTITPAIPTISFADNNNNAATQDFCLAANGSHQDLEVVIAPITPARPGFDAVYKIVYRNKGNTTLNAETAGLIMYYDIDKMDYVASSQPVTSQGSNSINFGYTTFAPFESRSLLVTMRMHSPTDANPVNIGDVLNFAVGISPNNLDENMDDNYFVYDQTVVGSFDPNSIECLEGAVVPSTEIGNYLHYAINFENTGTFPAENIVVKTEVDTSKFDIGSLQLMNTSFPVEARITANKVEFIFENINLDIGGHGHILLKIKTNNTLVTGDAVANRGDIFFDYNAPIDTGMANTVFQTLSNTGFEVDDSVSMVPNPASNDVTVNANNTIKSIELYDAQGRIVMTSLVKASESKLNISSQSKGIYFVKITTEKGTSVQKLVKK